MKIHEYQAKELLAAYGAPVPGGFAVKTPEEAFEAASRYSKCVVKAQIHSGGRGKAGGVKLASSPEEAKAIAAELIGKTLVTKQTGPAGKKVRTLLVTEAVNVEKEFYLSITADPSNACLTIIASSEGGMEIEETAVSRPEAILRLPISPSLGFRRFQGLDVAAFLGLDEALTKQLVSLLDSMTRLYVEKDCSLVEINPLVIVSEICPDTGESTQKLLCLDAKVSFDDNALFRHEELLSLRDITEEDPKEYAASLQDLSYVSMDGNIGCLVNGAGLAMATMDILGAFGGKAANFLDVGGSATAERVKAAFELLLSDDQVKAIFVNIFGGIMKCDVIAEGVVQAAREMALSVPLIVRLEGTNAQKGQQILKDSGLRIFTAPDMASGAKLSIEKAAEQAASGGSL